jgi:hypothetical protein
MKKQKFVLYTNPNNVTSRAYTCIGTKNVNQLKKDAYKYQGSYRIIFEGSGTEEQIKKTQELFSYYTF